MLSEGIILYTGHDIPDYIIAIFTFRIFPGNPDIFYEF